MGVIYLAVGQPVLSCKRHICSSFSAFDTREYPQSMASVGTLPPNTHVYLGDVKNMYTNIPHPRLYEVVDWVLARAAELCPGLTVFVPNSSARKPCQGDYPHVGVAGHTISLSQLSEVLKWDIAHIYFTLGDRILRQTEGVPMGSPCSPALAVALCMHSEHHFIATHPDVVIYRGFRYIDDLLLFLKEPCADIATMYPPPLQLEEEVVGDQTQGYTWGFLEAYSTLRPDGAVDIVHYHKNAYRTRAGKPPLKNVPHFSTHVPNHAKFGRVVGALTRAWSHSVGDTNKVNATLTVLMELDSMGMPKNLARQAIKRMAYKTDSGLWPTEVETRYLAHAGVRSC